MTKTVTAIPVWSAQNMPSPELLINETEHLHFAPSTIERAIDRLKDEQADYLTRLERDRLARRAPTTVVGKGGKIRLGFPGAAAAKPQPAVTPAVRPSAVALADVHPLVRADALRRAQGDVRRLRVLSLSSVLVLNRPCGD